ncbi:MAG: NUDIX domain-containing protein [Verrucomicrobiota bacterium]
MSITLPFRISVLLFIHNPAGELLLIERRKVPNMGCWSPIGGKLEMDCGESPFECAIREAKEEAGMELTEGDLHLFGMVSEKGYEGTGHWLMFLFDIKKPLTYLPETIDEGRMAFYTRAQVDTLKLPETDRILLWPYYDSHRTRFLAMRADCHTAGSPQIVVEESQ